MDISGLIEVIMYSKGFEKGMDISKRLSLIYSNIIVYSNKNN